MICPGNTTAPRVRWKKPFGGNRERLPPDEFVLFLDENIHNCQPIVHALRAANIPYQRFGDYFSPGTPDETWLPHVGQQGWLLITVDKKIRYNELERRAIVRNRVREFVFTSGNLSGSTMAELLVKAFRCFIDSVADAHSLSCPAVRIANRSRAPHRPAP